MKWLTTVIEINKNNEMADYSHCNKVNTDYSHCNKQKQFVLSLEFLFNQHILLPKQTV